MLLLQAYVMFVTPFEGHVFINGIPIDGASALLMLLLILMLYPVCFLDVSVEDGLFWVNRVVDACFLADICFQFYLIPEVSFSF